MTVAPSTSSSTTTTTPAISSTATDPAARFAATTAAAVAAATAASRPLPTPTNGLATKSMQEVPTDATCVEFLHLMKAFSESAVNVTEMAQRVDSLVHQDEQLLRLLPLASPHDGGSDDRASSGRGSTSGSVADTTDDESTSGAVHIDVDAMAAAMDVSISEGMKKFRADTMQSGDDDDELDDDELDMDLDVDLDEGNDDDDEDDDIDDFVSDDMDVDHDDYSMDDDDGASTDAETRSSSQARIGSLGDEDDDENDDIDEQDRERRAQEDLQRWMELELDLDTTVDPYDASLHLPGVDSTLHIAPAPAPASATTTAAPSTSVANAALGVHATLATTAGSHANSSSVLSTTTALASKNRFRASVFDRKSVTAALFEDDDDDEDADDVTDLVLMSSLMRKKTALAAASSQKPSLSGNKRPLEQESKTEDDAHGGTIWGMEVDSYEQDLLSSIDHAVLCDRENRFLQWDLEIEAATAAAVAAAAVSQKAELRTPPASITGVGSGFSGTSAEARQKLMLASSPRDHKINQPLRSPSNVDTNLTAEDWSSLDFGTFQNRTVSHILSSCLHKRKLHHPYKDRVTLVNFNVPGGEPIGPVPTHNALPSVTGSLLFGAGLETADVLLRNEDRGALLGLLSGAAMNKDPKMIKSGEKKAKKPRDGERKKMSMKSDGFGGFEGDDQDGRPAKAMKFENLPLPDLTNLPQDLKELKRKIEATEHKVEGTKHRHRKGGPCPRCQVQNQLRAAKRAYHKRAVAHKKVPQLGAVSPALTATAVDATPPPQPTVAPSPVITVPTVSTAIPPPTTAVGTASTSATIASGSMKSPTLKVVASPASVAAVPTAPSAPANIVRPATVASSNNLPGLSVSSNVGTTTMVRPAPSVGTASTSLPPTIPAPKVSAPTTSPSTIVLSPNMAAASAVAAPSPFPRRSCGENALASPFSSPSSVPTGGSAPSSPESASPQVHHVTVTSA